MPPSFSSITLLKESKEQFVHIISELLTTAECDSIIQKRSVDMVPHFLTLTKRLRCVFDDDDLSSIIWERLRPFYDSKSIVDEDGCNWLASGCNSRFRFCRYEPGGVFEPHVDGRRLASVDSQSFMTVNIYLNTVPPEDGGSTRVLSTTVSETGGAYPVLAHIHPVKGSAAIFRDSLFHDGEELRSGEKYLLRTDILFSREHPFDFNSACAGRSNKEKAIVALEIAVGLEDGNNANEAAEWYRRAYKLDPVSENVSLRAIEKVHASNS